MLRDTCFYLIEPTLVSVEVNQEDQVPNGMTIQFRDEIHAEALDRFDPAAGDRQHPNNPDVDLLKESVRNILVGVVFREDKDMWLVSIDAHASRSSRRNAPTRSPEYSICSTGRTIVGSR